MNTMALTQLFTFLALGPHLLANGVTEVPFNERSCKGQYHATPTDNALIQHSAYVKTQAEPTPKTKSSRPKINPCFLNSVDLNLENAKVLVNNLGGFGPKDEDGDEKIQYNNVFTNLDGRSVDLEITASGYQPGNAIRNGKKGAFGVINFAAGVSAKLKFSFVDTKTRAPVSLEHFEFTFFDIDQASKVKSRESIEIDGFDEYLVVPGHEMKITRMSSVHAKFTSTKAGYGCDNPEWPEMIGNVTCQGRIVDQEKRAVMFLFSGKNSFEATISVTSGDSSRNILFAGASTLVRLCPELTPKPTPKPPRPDIERCFPESVQVDFAQAKVPVNNLGGFGPKDEDGDEKIQYKNILTNLDGRSVDLEITASGYQPGNAIRNGKKGAFGVINFAAGVSAKLKFSFVDTKTRAPVSLEHFEFTFFDIDQASKVKSRESIEIDGFDEYLVVPGHEMKITRMSSVHAKFTSTKAGYGCDNPEWPEMIGNVTCQGRIVDQEKRAVMFLFSGKNSFEATISVTSGDSSRNILFAGASTLVRLCPDRVRG